MTKQLQTHLEQELDIRESTLQLTHGNFTEILELQPLIIDNLLANSNKINGDYNSDI